MQVTKPARRKFVLVILGHQPGTIRGRVNSDISLINMNSPAMPLLRNGQGSHAVGSNACRNP